MLIFTELFLKEPVSRIINNFITSFIIRRQDTEQEDPVVYLGDYAYDPPMN